MAARPGWKCGPALDQFHVERAPHVTGKAIDPPLPLCGDKCRLPGRCQAAALPRHSQKRMAKAVIIKETMHIGAERETVGADNAIAQGGAFAQPCDLR